MSDETPSKNGTVLVTGGTGTLGRHLVPLLEADGHEICILSRHAPTTARVEHATADLLKDEGVEAAVSGVDTIVHLAGGPKGDDTATGNLVRAAKSAGVRHIVYISVIASDAVPLGYFRSKFGAEKEIEQSGIPWTTLRAAQFHDLTLSTVRAMAKLPIVPAPGGVRWQPVDSRDVAERLAELTLGHPAGRVADLAGPTVYSLADLTRSYLRARGKRRPFLPVRVPGKMGRAYRSGANLTLDGAGISKRTWEDFLAEQVSAGRE
ncbi:MAG: NAD(P)H-binding protein [Actinomycetia bacterium]|nr:NAD(P)H-binding protein [Actinomycetes bacterium]